MLDDYSSFAHAHEAVIHIWGVLMLAGVGTSLISVGIAVIHGTDPVWIRPVQNGSRTWRLEFFCQESGVGHCYVSYLLRQGPSHRRHFLGKILERYIHPHPDMHKFTEGIGQATFAGSGLTRVEKADRRAGRFPGPSVFGTWAAASYPFRWQIEYVRRAIGVPGLPQAFAVPPAGVRIFSDGRADFDELPHEIRTEHRGEVRNACVQLGLPDRSDRSDRSDRVAGDRARDSGRGSGRRRSRSRARAVRVASDSAVARSESVESRDGALPAEATSTASGAPAVVAGPVVPEGSVSVRARVVPEVHAGVRALLAEDEALLAEAARAGF